MPTGYTAAIADGITFKRFALLCARAFLAPLHEAPGNVPIPEAFEPSAYYKTALANAEGALEALLAIAPDAVEALAELAHQTALGERLQWIAERNDLKCKYETMLAGVRALEVPIMLDPYKRFMAAQIEQSLESDCDMSYWREPERLSADVWIRNQISDARRDIARCEKRWQQEVEQTTARNVWVAALHKSLTHLS